MARPRVPIATYRLQFNRDFGFADACGLVPYLHRLGITDLYASPLLAARPGSPHGYDVTDPTRLNPELGSPEEFDQLVAELQHHDMGLLLDFAPNHMAATAENPWWAEVLESGRASPYASYFDIDWERNGDGRLVLPVLGAPTRNAIAAGELTLALEEGAFQIRYYDQRFPLDMKTYGDVLGGEVPASLAGPAAAIERLPDRDTTSPRDIGERCRAAEAIKLDLRRVRDGDAGARRFLEERVAAVNGRKEALERLLQRQAYRLEFWRTGSEEINYRRFFDITDLVCLRVEDPQVFEHVHRFVFQMVDEGKVTGFRIDHIDGLHDPTGYLERIQERQPGLYVLAEKILIGEEPLPPEWPAHGTTGYDSLNYLNAAFVDPKGFRALEEAYARFTGDGRTFSEVRYEGKRKALDLLFRAEVRVLARQLADIADREGPSLDASRLEEAVREVIACLPVYRTYVRDFEVPPRDRPYIERALAEARNRLPDAGDAIDFMARVLLLDFPASLPAERRDAWLHFVMRWQQFTGPVMAKGVEDTALYVHNPLVSLNEVGGEPEMPDGPVATFHERNRDRHERWPLTLNAASTHDTKRSEDVRARLDDLSEMPGAWARRLGRWRKWNRSNVTTVAGQGSPDAHEETLLYQAMLGAWPLDPGEEPEFRERLKVYAVKAAREAKMNTSWRDPDEAHEDALGRFIDAALEESPSNRFLDDFRLFQRRVAYYGALISLSQTLLRIATPGVPDFYRGAELWDFSLVDPDNRRPVDFRRRIESLEALQRLADGALGAHARELMDSWQDGRVKLFVIWRALGFREALAALFRDGDYLPLSGSGDRAENVVAFARRLGGEWAVVAVPRLVSGLRPARRPPVGRRVWRDTVLRLPAGAPERWRNALTGEILKTIHDRSGSALALGDVFRAFPVALLAGSYLHGHRDRPFRRR